MILYHCSELTVHRKFNSSSCKPVLYRNLILIFPSLNINMYWQHHHYLLHKPLYRTAQSSWSTEMHLNHLPSSLFPLQLLYSHKSALINMHHNKGGGEQTILQPNQPCNHLHCDKGGEQTILQLNQQCNYLHYNKGSREQTILQPNQLCNHLHHNKGSKQTILQLNQQCNHITGLWIRSDTSRPNWYISLQSCIWAKGPPIYPSFIILGLNHSSAVIVMHYTSKMRWFSQVDTIFLAV